MLGARSQGWQLGFTGEGVRTAAELAETLRRLRRREARRRGKRELTYRELAAKTGWSHAMVGQYLTGRTVPSTDRFDTLIRLLGATPAEQGALATARDRVVEGRQIGRGPVAPAGPLVPRQLPPAVPCLAGRLAEIAALDRLLDEAASSGGLLIGTIEGAAGVGKSALAVHWAHRVADRFPDGQLYVNLHGFGPGGTPLAVGDALRAFLATLNAAPQQIPDDVDRLSAVYRSLLGGRRVLVVLDNAWDAAQVRPLLPGAPGCVVVVTSRNRLTSLIAVDAARPIPLDMLGDEAAVQLLTDRLGADRIAGEAGAVAEIVRYCAGLPLALCVASARAATEPGDSLVALARELREAPTGLSVLDGGDPASDIRTVFSWSYRRLSESARRLFRLLRLNPVPDIGVLAAASLAGLPAEQVQPLLDELVRMHLVVGVAPGRYACHRLLREYAKELARQLDPEVEQRAAELAC